MSLKELENMVIEDPINVLEGDDHMPELTPAQAIRDRILSHASKELVEAAEAERASSRTTKRVDDFCYYVKNGRSGVFYRRSESGAWEEIDRKGLEMHFWAQNGYNYKRLKKEKKLLQLQGEDKAAKSIDVPAYMDIQVEVSQSIAAIQDNRVHDVVDTPFLPRGISEEAGYRILNKSLYGLKLLPDHDEKRTAKKTEQLLSLLLGDSQSSKFKYWSRILAEGAEARKETWGQVLFLIGPYSTFLANTVLKDIFFIQDAYTALNMRGTLNAHIGILNSPSLTEDREINKFSAWLDGLAAQKWGGRIVVCLDEEAADRLLPRLDILQERRVLALKLNQVTTAQLSTIATDDIVGRYTSKQPEEKRHLVKLMDVMEYIIKLESNIFLSNLYKSTIPATDQNEKYGMRGYIHPDLLETFKKDDDVYTLKLAFIEYSKWGHIDEKGEEFTAAGWLGKLQNREELQSVQSAVKHLSMSTAGKALKKLAREWDGLRHRKSGNNNFYRLVQCKDMEDVPSVIEKKCSFPDKHARPEQPF